jgi:hypothetical protein
MAAHADAVHWLAENWLWAVIAFWVFGGSVEEWWRRTRKRHRKAAELRHRRRVELARAKAGQPYTGARPAVMAGMPDVALPAAAIAAPPSARPAVAVPGPCQHEKIIPVITADGELVRWVCANYPRCDAKFPPSTALYEPGGEA